MNEKCTRCGADIDTVLRVCGACGMMQNGSGLISPPPLGDLDIDFELESEITDISQIAAANAVAEKHEDTPEATAAREMKRALKITGITDGAGVLADTVPLCNPKFDVRSVECTPFEAYLLSLADGYTPLSDIMELSGLTLYEVITAFASLHDKGAITLEKAEDTPKPTVPKEEADLAALGRVSLRRSVVKKPATDLADTDPDILMQKADRELKAGAMERAREYARLALVHAPNSHRAKVLVNALNDPAYAQSRAKILLGHGIVAYRSRDYTTAVRLLKGAIEEHDGVATIHHRLAIALVKSKGDLREALWHCERAIFLAPNNATYRRNHERITKRLQSES